MMRKCIGRTGNTLQFQQATPNDTAHLRYLAHQSEAHWGYGEAFMDTFDHTFNITEQFIRENPVYVSWDHENTIAFWGLKRDGGGWELEYFYISEQCLGKGYGKQMWNHLTDWCRRRSIPEFHFVTSPQAIGFYEKWAQSRMECGGHPLTDVRYRILFTMIKSPIHLKHKR